MNPAKLIWVSIAAFVITELAFSPYKVAHAFFGEDLPLLAKILTETIQQVRSLQSIIGSSRETVSLLQEMNRGVKEVLHIAQTAHIPLPKQVYDTAVSIDQAAMEAEKIYGKISGIAPGYTRTHYQSGVEGLFLSQDAFEYSRFLDDKGERIKGSAIVASQASATRLTAESLGVLLHAVSHSNRIQAKNLEIMSTKRIEDAAKESARYESFVDTHATIERDFKGSSFLELNLFFRDDPISLPTTSSSGGLP